MSKPAASIKLTGKSLAPFGPAYGFREGSGTSTADDSGVAPAGSLRGGAAWASTPDGSVVRLANNGDWVAVLWANFDSDFEADTTAVTLLLGVKPTTFPGRPGQQASYFHRQYGAEASVFGIWNVGSDAHPGTVEGHIYTPNGPLVTPNGLELTAGTAYILALRCQQNAPLRLRVYDRATGQQIGAELVSTATAVGGRITMSGVNNPFLIGGYTAGSPGQYVRTIPGDYDFFFFSPTYLTDSQVDAFVADPFTSYAASAKPSFTLSPASATVNAPVALTATGTNTSWTIGTTFSVGGGTGASISKPSVDVGAQTATFTLNPGSAAGTLTIANTTDGATATVAAQAAFDWLAAFESTMQWAATGQPHAYPQYPGYFANGDDHYDPIGVFEQIRAYTGSSSWDAQVAGAIDHYREQGVSAGGGYVQGHVAYADGLAAHYERTGDTKSRDAAILVSRNAAGSYDPGPTFYFAEQSSSREVAFSILTKLASERLGCAHRPRMEEQVAAALGHIAQWTAPAGQRLLMTYTRPFMVGLTMDALIAYWDRYRAAPDTGPGSAGNLAAQIPAAIKTACDWLWANCWHGDPTPDDGGGTWPYGGFQYTAEDLRTRFDDVPSTVTSATSGVKFRGGSGLSTQDDFYKYAQIQFTSGPLNGQTLGCSGYTGSTREFRFDFGQSFSATPAVGDAFKFTYLGYPPSNGSATYGPAIGQSGDTLLAPALNPLVAPAYAWLGLRLGDPAYLDKFAAIMSGSAALRFNPGTQKVYNQTFKTAIKGVRWYQRALAEYPAATALTLAGPGSTGRVNAMSDRFTVALSGASGVKFSTANPVTATPSDGSDGDFFPAAIVLTPDRPKATFRYRPRSAGTKSISVANDGSLANPAAVAYTPIGTAAFATGIAATPAQPIGPATPPVGLTFAFTPAGAVSPVAADATGGLVILGVAASNGGGVAYSTYGAMSGLIAAWIGGDDPALPMHLVLPPDAIGTCTIAAYNDVGLPSPATSTYAVGPPMVLSAAVDEKGTLLTLDFSGPVIGESGFTLSGGHSLGTPSGSGRSRTYQVAPVAVQNEVLTLAYMRGNVADATNASNQLDGFSGFAINNRSIIQKPTPPAPPAPRTPPKYPPFVPRPRSRPRPFGRSR